MKTLFLQTDTTGAYLFREPVEDPRQPHLARLAWVEADTNGPSVAWCRLVRPRAGWAYEPDAVAANGITREEATNIGTDLRVVMGSLVQVLANVDRVVAFNADFHRKVLEHAAFECGLNWEYLFTEVPVLCAMRESTDIVRKPRMQPGGGYAWPKFREAFEFFSDDDLPGLDDDPIDRGIALAIGVQTIYDGIEEYRLAQRSAPHE